MREMDCVEVIVEKERYAKEGVHKGMQGWICYPERVNSTWLVNFPQYGAKDDIAEISIKEEDLRQYRTKIVRKGVSRSLCGIALILLPNGMDARVNERIREQFGE